MDNQEVMDIEAQIEDNNDDRTLPFSIFKKANLPITLKVYKFIYSYILYENIQFFTYDKWRIHMCFIRLRSVHLCNFDILIKKIYIRYTDNFSNLIIVTIFLCL